MSSRLPRSGNGGAYGSRWPHSDDRDYAGESQSYSRGYGRGQGRGRGRYNSWGAPRDRDQMSHDSTRAYPRAGSHSSDGGYSESRSYDESRSYRGGHHGRQSGPGSPAPRGRGQTDTYSRGLRSGDRVYGESRSHSGGHGHGQGRGRGRHSASGRTPRDRNTDWSDAYYHAPMWCYLHLEGAKEISESVLFFEQYKGHNPGNFYGVNSKTTVYQVSISDCKTSKGSDLQKLVTGCPSPTEPKPEALHATLSGIYGATSKHPDGVLQSMKEKNTRVRIITDHVKDIQLKLSDELKSLVQEHIPTRGQGNTSVSKLEARFGKVVWKNVPEDFLASDEGITVENFSELIFEKSHHRIFKTIVLEENVEQLTSVLDCKGTAVETFDFVFTAVNQEGGDCRMDARLRILGSGEKVVLLVKEGEKKIVLFDIICLHRQCDIRIALNCMNIVPQDLSHQLYQITKQMLDTVQYSQDQILSFVPRSNAWAVRSIRHKVRTPYIIDDKYIVTVSLIKEYFVEWMNAKHGEPQSVKLKDFKTEHLEVEFHNARWVTAFGRNAGLSPEESLERMLHMDLSDVTPELTAPTPHPWTVESIAKDLEEFLDHSESLNDTLGEVATAQ